jgi:sigma-B regulation protein RsbU (phosphoserine phosphatase)
MSSAAPSSSSSPPPRQQFAQRIHRGAKGVQSFWSQVTEGIKLQDLWAQFRSEARSSYGLYSREVDWEKIGESKKWQRPFRAARALFWALLMKLSPTRRVVLLLALVLMVLPVGTRTQHGDVTIEFPWHGIGVALVFLLLALELADRVTMKRDLEIAREIQRWLVPESPPNIPGADLAFATRAANTVAGDYYDALLRGGPLSASDGASAPVDGDNGGRLLVVVADVAGKSVPAAILMATFQASLRALEGTGLPFEELIHGVNRYACANSLNGLRFVTAFFAEIDMGTRDMRYVCAGHNPPLLRRTDGAVEKIAAGGLPLGIEPKEKYEVGRTRLNSGDRLVIYTDGVVEAVNEKDDDFGMPRLEELVRATPAGESAAQTLARISGSVDQFAGQARQRDDITCLVLRVN